MPHLKRLSSCALFLLLACAPDEVDVPAGPCNSDGGTGTPVIGDEPPVWQRSRASEPATPGFSAPPPAAARGWSYDEDRQLFYRFASEAERERNRWSSTSILVAISASRFADLIDPAQAHKRVPLPGHPPVQLERVGDFELGWFVEHRSDGSGAGPSVDKPSFVQYGLDDREADVAARLLISSSGALVAQVRIGERAYTVRGPQRSLPVSPPPPPAYRVVRIEPSVWDVQRGPLEPYDCQNGECVDPDEPPVDACNDGLDNDGDGHADLCDWNCLPHADFGANDFPEARSRTEAGKIYALMGHGSFCTLYPDTWELEFAQTAVQAAAALNGLRPDLQRPIRYRTFSCWVFEDFEAYQLCQFGPYEGQGEDIEYSPPICPPGLEDYPYQPSELDQLHAFDQANLFWEEASPRTWADFQLNSTTLAEHAEPRNGVVLVTSEPRNICLRAKFPDCPANGGLAHLPWDAVATRGTAGVLDEPFLSSMWRRLAHETGHTIGLVHDDVPMGFMNEFGGAVFELGDSVDPDYPNISNPSHWELGLTGSKGENPRSPGFYLTGCEGPPECAPLGKPGWACEGLYCVEQ